MYKKKGDWCQWLVFPDKVRGVCCLDNTKKINPTCSGRGCKADYFYCEDYRPLTNNLTGENNG